MTKRTTAKLSIASIIALAFAFGCNSSKESKPSSDDTAAKTSAEQGGEKPDEHANAEHDAAAKKSAEESASDKLLAAEQAAYKKARPIFGRYCAKCHMSKGNDKLKKKALPHFNMDSYPFGGHHAGEIDDEIRKELGATGKKPGMPKDDPGAVKGEDLDLILAWADAFDASKEAGLHEDLDGDHHDGDHDDEVDEHAEGHHHDHGEDHDDEVDEHAGGHHHDD